MGGEAETADPATMLMKKQAGKGGGREPGSEDPSPARQRCVRAVPPCAVLAALLSVVALMSCLYLGVKTNDLQARIAALEAAKGDPSIRLLPDCLDQLKAVVQEKVERLLAQVWKAGVFCKWSTSCIGVILCTRPASALMYADVVWLCVHIYARPPPVLTVAYICMCTSSHITLSLSSSLALPNVCMLNIYGGLKGGGRMAGWRFTSF